MLANLLHAAWLFGVIGLVTLLIYGGWLVLRFQRNASIANQQAVARLALHESQPRDELLNEMKVAALGFEKENGSLKSPQRQSGVTVATVSSLRPNIEGSHRVLVVEDNLDAVHSMATLIKMMGHDCRFAINGFAALEIAREFRPEIILLDIGLPDFKGYDIAKQLKWEPGLEATRIIAITALPDTDRQRAIDAGCDEFYRKPLDPMLLEQLLAKPLGFDQRAAA
jgi:CheY-like chemotaxis protein